MSLVSNISALAGRISDEFRLLREMISGSKTGSAAGLTTTSKNLVGAINELKLVADAAADIDDSTSVSNKVYSSQKTDSQISAAIDGLIDAAPGTLNTLNEIAVALQNDVSGLAALTTVVSGKADKTFVDSEVLDIRTKLGASYGSTDFKAAFETALAYTAPVGGGVGVGGVNDDPPMMEG